MSFSIKEKIPEPLIKIVPPNTNQIQNFILSPSPPKENIVTREIILSELFVK